MKDPDCRRGPSLTRLCVDEAQDFDGDEFESVFRPLLAAKQAPCDFSGTLKYGSWFHNEWLAAEEGRIKDAAAFWFPSTSNPLIPSTEWDDVKKELSRKNRMDIWDNEYICDPHQKATGDSELRLWEFNPLIHVIAPCKIPSNHRIFCGLDWGISPRHPTAGVWGALSPQGFLTIFNIYKKSGLDVSYTAKNLLEKGKAEAYILDETCWFKESDGKNGAARFIEAGIRPLYRGKRDDKAKTKTALVKSWFKPINGPPRVKIFSDCRDLIECISNLKWEDDRGDDLFDAMRYLICFISSISFKNDQSERKIGPIIPRFDSLKNDSSGIESGYFI